LISLTIEKNELNHYFNLLKYIDKDPYENSRNFNLLKAHFDKLKYPPRTTCSFK